MSIFTRKLPTHIAIIIVLVLIANSSLWSQSLSNVQPTAPVVEVRNSARFVAIIQCILTDPIEGYWLRCQCGRSSVLIWEDDVHDLAVGTKYHVLCTYLGAKSYPEAGEINIYDAIVWEAIE